MAGLYSYLVAIVALLLMLTFWVAVQLVWRRVFRAGGDDIDVLALRRRCGCCTSAARCQRPGGL